jgi:hypothetical protein
VHCPQCGQQQVSESLRFCSRCGFPLEAVVQVLASGGMLPFQPSFEGRRGPSPRRKGVRQGAALFLAGAVLVPILGILNAFTPGPSFLDILVPLAAIVFFVGGLMRMLFAAVFEEGASARPIMRTSYVPPSSAQLNAQPRNALPPAPANPDAGWRPRANAAEGLQPPSITENTTRLLNKDEPESR